MLEMFKEQVSRIESRGSRNKAFSNKQKLERVLRKQCISRRKNNTVLLKTKCRPAVDDGNLPVNADNPLRSEPFAKLLK